MWLERKQVVFTSPRLFLRSYHQPNVILAFPEKCFFFITVNSLSPVYVEALWTPVTVTESTRRPFLHCQLLGKICVVLRYNGKCSNLLFTHNSTLCKRPYYLHCLFQGRYIFLGSQILKTLNMTILNGLAQTGPWAQYLKKKKKEKKKPNSQTCHRAMSELGYCGG